MIVFKIPCTNPTTNPKHSCTPGRPGGLRGWLHGVGGGLVFAVIAGVHAAVTVCTICRSCHVGTTGFSGDALGVARALWTGQVLYKWVKAGVGG